MSLGLASTKTALASNATSSFLATGGTPAYVYTVRAGGAGGTINSSTGLYTAPALVPSDPKLAYDTIQVVDSLGAVATATILVGTPLILFCEILQQELGLEPGRVYLWDQKIFQPTDADLYIAVSVPSCKAFANNTVQDSSGDSVTQSVNMMAVLDLDIMSRGPAARDRKEEVLMAVASQYSESQQEANSFYIGRLPPGARFTNLSMIDGAAIPYRYRISINMQYAVTKIKTIEYFNDFVDVEVTTNP